MNAPQRGKFVVFEGLDGSGTTTQVRYLRDSLVDSGIHVEVTHEPSNGPVGAALRQTIEGRVKLDPVAQALAFAADRADHLQNEYNGVEKSLREGSWVICDRYVLSGLAYQASMGLDIAWLQEINSFAVTPDVTIFIDTPAEVCAERINTRGRHLELFHDVARLKEVQALYYRVLRDDRFTGHLIQTKGDRPVDDVKHDIDGRLSAWFAESTRNRHLTSP